MQLQGKIIDKIEQLDLNAFTINDIIELGSYNNLRKTLERMTKDKIIRRLIRGVYDIPKYNKTFNMYTPPSIDGIAKAIARNFNWDIYPTGNYALNVLGLSTQIPSKYIYISSGPYRKYVYEENTIEFKHASLRETNSFSYNTNLVIQAIKELGKENINYNNLKAIANNFSLEELENICNESKNTTVWIYECIKRMRGISNEKCC